MAKPLPHSLEAEASLIGAMLMDRGAAAIAFDALTVKDFYSETNGKIFAAMLELFQEGYSIDPSTLCERLTRNNYLEAVGGVDKVFSLIESVATSANAEHHARIIREKSILRQGVNICAEYHKQFWGDGDPDKIISGLSNRVALLPSSKQGEGFATPSAESDRMKTHIEGVISGVRLIDSVESGVEDFDTRIGGFYPGDYWVIAARPSIGKTALALDMAWNISAFPDRSCAIASLEMGKRGLMERFIARLTGISIHNIRQCTFGKNNLPRVQEACQTVAKRSNLFIDDTPGLEVSRLRSRISRLKMDRPDLRVVFVDYIQIIRSGLKNASPYESTTFISGQLKVIARESNVCVVALSQLRRSKEGEGKEPALDSLKESGAIEQDADGVLLLHRKDREDQIMKCIIAKQRQGAVGAFHLHYNLVSQIFSPYSERAENAP